MTEKNKKTREAEEEDLGKPQTVASLFTQTKEEILGTGWSALMMAKENIADPLRTNINWARRKSHKVYDNVEEMVGKERLISTLVGAGKGSTVGMAGGPHGIVIGTVIGGVAGFVAGPLIMKWLNNEQNNIKADENSNQTAQPETAKDEAALKPPETSKPGP